jgi:signal transduction histidine kinase
LIVLPMDVRRNLFLIYKEALNNISKYASATLVSIEIIKEKKALKVSITDNGVGFNMKILTEGNGLMNMRKRAELIKGSLEINSALGKGTSLKLTIPVNK